MNLFGGRGGREEGWDERREGGMTVIHVYSNRCVALFNSNPMVPQYLNNNLT